MAKSKEANQLIGTDTILNLNTFVFSKYNKGGFFYFVLNTVFSVNAERPVSGQTLCVLRNPKRGGSLLNDKKGLCICLSVS